jgi:hypothetical protein
MKTLKLILILPAVLMLLNISVLAQKNYDPVIKEDGIEISYRWGPSKILKKDSPLMLFLKINNSNEFNAEVTFTVDYYWKGIRKASSEPNQICVKSMRTAKGRIKKLTFDRAEFSDGDLRSENFTLDVTGIKIEQTDCCRRMK